MQGENVTIWQALVNNLPAILTALAVLVKNIVDNRAKDKEIKALTARVDHQANINAALAAENQELHDQIAALVSSLGDSDKKVSILDDSYKFLRSQYDALLCRNGELQAKYDALKAQYDSLKTENARLLEKLSAMNKEIKKRDTGELKGQE